MTASSFSLTEHVEQAMERLREQQARMRETQARVEAMTASATTRNRMATAVVGSTGQVVSLTFHTTAYQAMAPAQLSALLVDLLNEARADVGEKVAAEMRSFAELGQLLRSSMAGGGTDLEKALEPLYAMRPAPPPGAPPRGANGRGANGKRANGKSPNGASADGKRQEHFDG